MDQVKIGKFIAICRKEKHLTQEQLAEKLDVSKNAVSKWERGICLMDIRLLQPLSEILEVSCNEILSGEKIASHTYKQKAEQNLIELSKYNHYHSVFIGALSMMVLSGLFMLYCLIKGLNYSGYASLLFSFGAFTNYTKYKQNNNQSLLLYSILMIIMFMQSLLTFILSTWQI